MIAKIKNIMNELHDFEDITIHKPEEMFCFGAAVAIAELTENPEQEDLEVIINLCKEQYNDIVEEFGGDMI